MGFTEQEKEQLRQIVREEIKAALTVRIKQEDLPQLSVDMGKSGRLSISTYQKASGNEL